MKLNTLFMIVASATAAHAHSTVTNVLVNGVDQGLGNSAAGYIRSPPNNNPVKDITSKDMTCNVNNVATAKTLSVAGGDTITFEWHHNDASASDDIIAASHLGPVLVYIAPTSSNGDGDVWVKLAEDGFKDGKWAVDTLIANRGKHSITLPDLAAGDYILRPEIIALHESDAAFNVNPARGAQFYMECVQIKVTSSGSKTLPAGASIPGTYKYTDPGVVFNLYGSFTSYPIPGPPVWDGASGSAPANPSSAVPTASATPTEAPAATDAPAATTAPAVTTTTPPSDPTTLVTLTRPSSSACVAPVTVTETVTGGSSTSTGTAGTVSLYGQCGGTNFKGATGCVAGSVCKVQNPYYSQCVAA